MFTNDSGGETYNTIAYILFCIIFIFISIYRYFEIEKAHLPRHKVPDIPFQSQSDDLLLC